MLTGVLIGKAKPEWNKVQEMDGQNVNGKKVNMSCNMKVQMLKKNC